MATDETVNSAGQALTDSGWLDLHFEAERPTYEKIVRSVGIRPGWHVLDAGCGGGSFIRLLTELVGPTGSITAIDHASENVQSVRQRLEASPAECRVEAEVGSILSLPLADNSVDAVWIANVLMYLSDDEVETALSECRRVTRPGGLIAAKEQDGRMNQLSPVPVELLRELGRPQPLPPPVPFVLRSRQNIHFFRDIGITDVRQRIEVSDWYAPLNEIQLRFANYVMPRLAGARLELEPPKSAAARKWLEAQLDPTSPDAVINHPRFSVISGHVVTTGSVTAD